VGVADITVKFSSVAEDECSGEVSPSRVPKPLGF
jgi:hypothetical protein